MIEHCLDLGSALEAVRQVCGNYEIRAHWQQGEFHHDVVIEVPRVETIPGRVLVVATNYNGGVGFSAAARAHSTGGT